MAKKKPDYAEIVEEAKESFDLAARLAGITKREREVTVYTDEVTGEALGGVEEIPYPGTKVIQDVRRWGVRGELHALREEAKALQDEDEPDAGKVADIKKRATALKKKATALQKKLDETSLTFTLRAVPQIVMKANTRKAMRNLGIKAKQSSLTPEQREDLAEEFLVILLSDAVVKWVDNGADGKVRTTLSVDDARALRQYLLPDEWAKLENALDELQAQKAIGDAGTADPDF